jgi:hypothetical protein
MRKLLLATVATAGMLGGMIMEQQAAAAPLSPGSTLTFGLTPYRAELQSNPGVAVGLSVADFIDFAPAGGGTGTALMVGTGGDLLGFSALGTVLDFDLTLASIMGFLTGTSGGNTFTLDLATITIEEKNDSRMFISGNAILSYMPGYDPTPGIYTMSFDIPGGAPNNFEFSFSANTTVIPEPGALALLGMGLLGMGAALRGRRKA